jgi:hypothetical protein
MRTSRLHHERPQRLNLISIETTIGPMNNWIDDHAASHALDVQPVIARRRPYSDEEFLELLLSLDVPEVAYDPLIEQHLGQMDAAYARGERL